MILIKSNINKLINIFNVPHLTEPVRNKERLTMLETDYLKWWLGTHIKEQTMQPTICMWDTFDWLTNHEPTIKNRKIDVELFPHRKTFGSEVEMTDQLCIYFFYFDVMQSCLKEKKYKK